MYNKQILLTLICCASMQFFASAQYAEPELIFTGGQQYLPSDLMVNNVNSDNSKDILSTDFNSKDLILLDNNGDGTFEKEQIEINLTGDLKTAFDAWPKHLNDLNNDDLADLYVISSYFIQLENNGSNNFTFKDSIFLSIAVSHHKIEDIDNDGDLDIIYYSFIRVNNVNHFWLENDGLGNFSAPQPITSTSNLLDSDIYTFEYFNDDEYIDLIIARYDGVAVYLNNENQIFTLETGFLQVDHYQYVEVKDIDQDGDKDIIGIGWNAVFLNENTPTGWVQNQVSTSTQDDIIDYQLAKINQNESFDLILIELFYDENLGEFKNQINLYSDITISEFPNQNTIIGTSEISIINLDDIDGDNLLDLAFLSLGTDINNFNGNIGWIKNEILLSQITSIEDLNLQFNIEDYGILARNLTIANSDADGQKEIHFTNALVNANKKELTVLGGDPLNIDFRDSVLLSQTESEINYFLQDPIFVEDIDGDGDNDVIQKINQNNYGVFRNNNNQGFGPAPEVINIAPTVFATFKIHGFSDFDSDGDKDMYASFLFDEGWKIAWLVNNGDGIFDNYIVIESSFFEELSGYKDVLIGDVNGDDLLDLIAFSDVRIAWYLNNGDQTYSAPKEVDGLETYDELSVQIADLNGDGDQELFVFLGDIACGLFGHNCSYVRTFNIYDYNNQSDTIQPISSLNSWPHDIVDKYEFLLSGVPYFIYDVDFKVTFKDFNGDNFIDIVSVDAIENTLSILYGDGEASFDSSSVITNQLPSFGFDGSFYEQISLSYEDLDADNDGDFILTKSGLLNSYIYLIENKSIDLGIDADEDGIILLYDCNDADSTILDTLLLPQILTTLENCEGDEISFEIGNLQNVDYTWLTPNGSNTSPSFEIESALMSDIGNYTVQASINQCESALATVAVDVFENPEVSIELLENILSIVSDDENLGIQWFLNGIAIPGATNVSYTPLETGDYHVEVVNENGCEATSEIFQHVVNGLLSNNVTELNIYPNPVSSNGYLTLNNYPARTANLKYQITNLNGQTFQTGMLQQNQTIEIENLPLGIYFLKIDSVNERFIGYFVVVE